jgi:hypothetical protein
MAIQLPLAISEDLINFTKEFRYLVRSFVSVGRHFETRSLSGFCFILRLEYRTDQF